MKVEFLRGASHELKHLWLVWKIPNQYENVDRYKDRDHYLGGCLGDCGRPQSPRSPDMSFFCSELRDEREGLTSFR